ncbi:methionine--tRNA ligase [Rickettsiales bacterium]|nr:methionine--tRNA ligase [Rickettsiales bacterium]
MKNSYITTPIYYVNDAPHIGHAYTSTVSDILARLRRLNNNNVLFLTGTDEHGQKVEKSALKKSKTPLDFCNEISLKFKDLSSFLDISNDDFIRTTQDRHKKTASFFWKELENNGWIYKDIYEGWYSIRDEAFYSKDELVDGKAPTGAEVEWHKEESYFFKLSAFQDILLKIYNEIDGFVCPKSKNKEVISFVKGGKEYKKDALKDLSISRTSFNWGVKVPGDEKHVMYVWLDALTNYLSALKYPQGEEYNQFWNNSSNNVEKIHIVGKDILRFHCVYWPAFLIASKFNLKQLQNIKISDVRKILPSKIFAHGWWTNEGQKISKSIGNVIDPMAEIEWLKSFEIDEDLAIDYFRYFLSKEVSFGSDGNYSRDSLINRINSELANNIGNLCQRTLSMIFKNNSAELVYNDDIVDQDSKNLLQSASNINKNISFDIDNCDIDKILSDIINLSSLANEYLHKKAPWSLKKEGKIDEMNNVLYVSVQIIKVTAIILLAFTPKSANKILDYLDIDLDSRNFNNISEYLPSGHKIKEPKPVFIRLK